MPRFDPHGSSLLKRALGALFRAMTRLVRGHATKDRDVVADAETDTYQALRAIDIGAAAMGRGAVFEAAEEAAKRPGNLRGWSAPPGRSGGPPPPRSRAGAPPPPSPGGRGPLPVIRPEEALRDLRARKVRVVAGGWQRVAEAYGRAHIFAAARAISQNVAERVHHEIVNGVRDGRTTDEITKTLMEVGGGPLEGWTRQYAATVFETNAASAHTAGVFRTAADPVVRLVIPAVAYSVVHDGDARPNHIAADGLAGAVDDPVWRTMAPPNGYRCRCTVLLRDRLWCERAGILLPSGEVRRATIPPGAHPDDGFRKGPHQGVLAALASAR